MPILGGVGRKGRGSSGAARAAAVGFGAGLAVGLLLWSDQIRRRRRDLFSPSPFRRFAALGGLGGAPSVESARLLHDYLRWETVPTLRRRGEAVLRRMEQDLE